MQRDGRFHTSIAVAALCLVIGDAEVRVSGQGTPQHADSARQVNAEELRKSRGLHAAALASEKKHYVGIEMIEIDIVAEDLDSVSAAADVVVRGTVGPNLTRIAQDENGKETVVLDYRFDVHEVFRGSPALRTDDLTLTIPGGRFEFADGSSVEILTPGFRKPGPGEEYVLFLSKDETYGNYKLAFGTQSLFWLHEDGSVEAQGASDYPTGQGTLRDGRRAFLDRVAQAVREK